MAEFQGVTVVKKANVFFDGGVTSRTIIFQDGTKKTLGIMQPGKYEFTTKDAEIMELLSGELEVLLPGKSVWEKVAAGESFNVTVNATFKLKVTTLTDYCCSLIK